MPPTTVERLRTRCRALAAINLLLIVFIAVYGLSRRLASPGPPATGGASSEIAATVDGLVIPQTVVDRTLLTQYGRRALGQLVVQELVSQEAARRGISVEPPAPPDPVQRTRLLVRKLVLQSVSDARLRHLYQLFKADLTQYELEVVVVQTRTDTQKVVQQLHSGTAFDVLARRYSGDLATRDRGGALGFRSFAAIQDTWGAEVAADVRALRPGGTTAPIHVQYGDMFLHVSQIRSGFDDIRPRLEDLIVAADARLLVQQLRQAAHMTSSVLAGSGAPSSSTPSASPAAEPRNAASETPEARSSVFATPSSRPQPHATSIFALPSSCPEAPESPTCGASSLCSCPYAPAGTDTPECGVQAPDACPAGAPGSTP